MKRLLGFIKDEHMPRMSTLDIVAQYMGYDCWVTLANIDNTIYSSSFSTSVRELRIDKLVNGTRVRFEYKPDRVLIIRYTGNHHFVVEHSENSKLLIGDELELWHMMRRYPLYVDNVVRDGEDLGSFTAVKAGGITAFKVLKEGEEV